MLKIYGIKNCSSMKKAFDLLTQLHLPFEFHDYKKQGIDADTLKKWLGDLGAERILNKKGSTWRKLTADEQHTALLNETNLINTLITHSSLIKRPVLQTQEGYIVGYDEAAYRALKQN